MIRFCFAAALVALLIAACGGDSDDDVNLRYSERCASCGMEWTVSMVAHSDVGARIRVEVQNTGERGAIILTLDRVASYSLNKLDAHTWEETYPAARRSNNAVNELQELVPTAVRWQPALNLQLPFTLAPNQRWEGEFTTASNVTKDVEGLVFIFTSVTYERPQPTQDFWVTWDAKRPYVGLRGEVTIN